MDSSTGKDGFKAVPSSIAYLSDAKLGSEADFGSSYPVGVEIPAAFQGTSLTLKVKTPTQTAGIAVCNEDGTAYTLTVAAGTYCPIPAQIGMALHSVCPYCATDQTSNVDVIFWCRELRG
jgi:hypothetical protein